MAYAPPRPILAKEPFAYFAPMPVAAAPVLPARPVSAIEQMYAYYSAE